MSAPTDFFGYEIRPGEFFCMAMRFGNRAEIKVGRCIKIDAKGRVVARMIEQDWGGKIIVQSRDSLLSATERMVLTASASLPPEYVLALKRATS